MSGIKKKIVFLIYDADTAVGIKDQCQLKNRF